MPYLQYKPGAWPITRGLKTENALWVDYLSKYEGLYAPWDRHPDWVLRYDFATVSPLATPRRGSGLKIGTADEHDSHGRPYVRYKQIEPERGLFSRNRHRPGTVFLLPEHAFQYVSFSFFGEDGARCTVSREQVVAAFEHLVGTYEGMWHFVNAFHTVWKQRNRARTTSWQKEAHAVLREDLAHIYSEVQTAAEFFTDRISLVADAEAAALVLPPWQPCTESFDPTLRHPLNTCQPSENYMDDYVFRATYRIVTDGADALKQPRVAQVLKVAYSLMEQLKPGYWAAMCSERTANPSVRWTDDLALERRLIIVPFERQMQAKYEPAPRVLVHVPAAVDADGTVTRTRRLVVPMRAKLFPDLSVRWAPDDAVAAHNPPAYRASAQQPAPVARVVQSAPPAGPADGPADSPYDSEGFEELESCDSDEDVYVGDFEELPPAYERRCRFCRI